ncbi:MAG: methyl-accepting chemotaxis protein [Desulfocapsaceae bacterium]|nr:methyl-accepting chemotaxis protein [Desulfocapsaceae bacterium]
MKHSHSRRAKNFFIKKNFQGKIVLALFLAVVMSCLLFILIFGFFSTDTMTISYENSKLNLGETPVMLLRKALTANWFFLVTCGTLLIIATIVGSHRIAGPLFRFEKVLNSMVRRDLTETIRLREKDEAKDLALQINTFNGVLSRDIRELNRRSRAINDLAKQYSALSKSNMTAEDIDSIFQAIRVNNEKIGHLLDLYQLPDK